MFDIFKVFNDNKAVLAEIPRFVNAWIDFMNKLHERLTRFEAALDRHDNKLQTMIEIVSDGYPATVTPDLHAKVEAWAADDPRQRELIGGLYDPQIADTAHGGMFNDPRFAESPPLKRHGPIHPPFAGMLDDDPRFAGSPGPYLNLAEGDAKARLERGLAGNIQTNYLPSERR